MTTVKPVTTEEDRPEVHKPGFRCPHCNAYAQQDWDDLGVPEPEEYVIGFRAIFEPPPATAAWLRAQCAKCGRSSIWLDDRMVYPQVSTLPTPHDDMPAEVLVLYNEARSVAGMSRRAGAAMARAAVEKLLRVLTENDRDQLIDLIDQVEPLVSSGLADLLMYVRHVGNSALHVKGAPDDALVLVLDEQTEAAVNALFETVNQLVDELVTRPAMTARLVGTVPETVKAKVEQLRAKRAQQGG